MVLHKLSLQQDEQSAPSSLEVSSPSPQECDLRAKLWLGVCSVALLSSASLQASVFDPKVWSLKTGMKKKGVVRRTRKMMMTMLRLDTLDSVYYDLTGGNLSAHRGHSYIASGEHGLKGWDMLKIQI